MNLKNILKNKITKKSFTNIKKLI